MNLDSKRLRFLLTALIATIVVWLIIFLVVGLPIAHLFFKIPVAMVASWMSICCAVQVAICPWLFYSRRTPDHPEGRITHRRLAVAVFSTTISVVFFFYLRHSRPTDSATREFSSIGMGVSSLFAVLYLLKGFVPRQRRKDEPERFSVK